jgi:hypothetical protein
MMCWQGWPIKTFFDPAPTFVVKFFPSDETATAFIQAKPGEIDKVLSSPALIWYWSLFILKIQAHAAHGFGITPKMVSILKDLANKQATGFSDVQSVINSSIDGLDTALREINLKVCSFHSRPGAPLILTRSTKIPS